MSLACVRVEEQTKPGSGPRCLDCREGILPAARFPLSFFGLKGVFGLALSFALINYVRCLPLQKGRNESPFVRCFPRLWHSLVSSYSFPVKEFTYSNSN